MSENEKAANRKSELRGSPPDADPGTLEPWIVRLLACPVDRSAVRLSGGELVCDRCGRRYQVRGGIPNMVPDSAESEQ